MNTEIFRMIDFFVTSTAENIHLQNDESLVVIKPDIIQHLNNTRFEMLHSLYEDKAGAEKTVEIIHKKYGTKKNIIVRDLSEIMKSLGALMDDEFKDTAKNYEVQHNPGISKYPQIAEIAVTYRCQNKCDFCSSSNPFRGKDFKEMTTAQLKFIIDKVYSDAKVSSISFTGGEPAMRTDLPELVNYASAKGIKTKLVTNGIKCSDNELVKRLSASGLHSAMVSLESHDELIHNRITGNLESYKKTIEGIHNLKNAGIQTRTNTTICRRNREHLIPLVKFVKEKFGFTELSMNMLIAAGGSNDDENMDIGYSSISSILEPVLNYCNEAGIKLVWHSPTPYCMFNPVDHNLGKNSCSCMSDLLSVNPAGDIIPCSAYTRTMGNMFNDSFTGIWNSEEARYFREKKFIPTVCKKCSMKILCKGACPLYWEYAGSYKEIEKVRKKRPLWSNLLCSIDNRLKIKTKETDDAESRNNK